MFRPSRELPMLAMSATYAPDNSPKLYDAILIELKGNVQFNKNHWRP